VDLKNEGLYIHDSDAIALKGFIREMVTQSLIPFMEGRVTKWNDQVASQRRGISARFVSLSKRIARFGSSKAIPSGLPDSRGLASSNFDSSCDFYAPETSEAILRHLGDYAFMLRDWKLAHATYELVRTDFGNDKAWKHHAAATEMSAISLLLAPQSMSSRSRSEMIDQLLNTASYSYLTRSSMSFGAIRCLTLAVELLKHCGAPSAEEAAKWGGKLLELRILRLTAQAFLSERIANSYRSRLGAGLLAVGSRRRQAAFWDLLAATTWIYQGTSFRAHDRLQIAAAVYQPRPDGSPLVIGNSCNLPFASMLDFWEFLEQAMV
jgi:trafficking protein particle complex subunit 8